MGRKLLLVVVGALACLTSAGYAAAEPFVDFYLGVANTSDPDFTARVGGVSVSGEAKIVDASAVIGGRAGYWLEALPWLGFAVDVSYFRLDEENGTGAFGSWAVPVSALLMLRWPLLKSAESPKGQLQPYVGIGPGVFFSDFDLELAGFADDSIDIGLDVRAGLAWQFHKNVALFGEYRFTYFKPEYEGTFLGVPTTTEFEYSTHHLAVGVSFRF